MDQDVAQHHYNFSLLLLMQKKLLNKLLFSKESFIVLSFSTSGGVHENLSFFISFKRMLNFFFAEIGGLLSKEFIEL